MTGIDLSTVYRSYINIACLNEQDWPNLEQFVRDDVSYNGLRIGISGYREMLKKDFHEIPDLRFDIQLLISDPPHVASRPQFNCSPKNEFLGLHVNGKKISFSKNMFYEFRDGRIAKVWSVIDMGTAETSG